MDQKTLKRLRPTDDTAAAIRAALNAIGIERATTEQRAAEMRSNRGKLLLTADAKVVLETDTEIQTASIFIEQLAIMTEELEAELTSAIARETAAARLVEAEAAAAVAGEAIQKWNTFYLNEYRQHAEALAAGIKLEAAAINAVAAARSASDAAVGAGARRADEALPSIEHPFSEGRPADRHARIGEFIRLPAAPGDVELIYDSHPPAPPRTLHPREAEMLAYARRA